MSWKLKNAKLIIQYFLRLCQNMNLLKGSGQAESHMVADGSYSDFDLANLRAIQAEHSRNVREAIYEWKEQETGTSTSSGVNEVSRKQSHVLAQYILICQAK